MVAFPLPYQARMIAAELDGELDDVDGDNIYRDRVVRLQREMDFMRKKMQQQEEEEAEQQNQVKSSMQRKVTEAQEEAENQQRHVANLRKKSTRVNQDLADMKLHLEEQTTRNAELEKKQRKFDNELHKISEQLREERLARERLQRERDGLTADRFTADQQLKNVQMDYELATDKAKRVEAELLEMSSASKDDKDLLSIKRQKNELERKVQDQEEELDEQAGTVQQLEQAKLRLEMATEKLRQQHSKEVEEKEVEMEELRATSGKRLKALEAQIEEEYEQRQQALKDKRDIEKKLQMLSEQVPDRDREVERRLRRDLKNTKALLADSQALLQRQKDSSGNRATIKQLRNQLEDAEYATAAAIKARKGVELEVSEIQSQLDGVTKAKAEVEARCITLTREKNNLAGRLEDVDEDYNEVMRKYQAVIKQQTVDTTTISDQSRHIEELLAEIQNLKELIAQLEIRCQYHQDSMVDKQVVVRLEAKIRDLESKLELETTTRNRAEGQMSRLKESVEHLGEERDAHAVEETRHMDTARRSERQLLEVREQLAECKQREEDATHRKHELEKKVDSLEVEFDQSQGDLKLAFKRIADLQATIEDEMDMDDSDADSYLDELASESDGSDLEELAEDYLVGSNRVSSARNSYSDSHASSSQHTAALQSSVMEDDGSR